MDLSYILGGESIKTKEIIKNKLEFLITDYDYDFDYNSNGKEVWCKHTNKYGNINWYSYEQFGEYELSIVENGKGKKYWILLDLMKVSF